MPRDVNALRKKLARQRAARARCAGASRGLGDSVARVTSAVGIPPCGGCKERQAALNRWVPYPRR